MRGFYPSHHRDHNMNDVLSLRSSEATLLPTLSHRLAPRSVLCARSDKEEANRGTEVTDSRWSRGVKMLYPGNAGLMTCRNARLCLLERRLNSFDPMSRLIETPNTRLASPLQMRRM